MDQTKILEEKLREASCFGDIEAVEILLKRGVAVNAKHDINGWTALHWACKRNHVNIVQLLLRHGADPSTTGTNQEIAANLTANGAILAALSKATAYRLRAAAHNASQPPQQQPPQQQPPPTPQQHQPPTQQQPPPQQTSAVAAAVPAATSSPENVLPGESVVETKHVENSSASSATTSRSSQPLPIKASYLEHPPLNYKVDVVVGGGVVSSSPEKLRSRSSSVTSSDESCSRTNTVAASGDGSVNNYSSSSNNTAHVVTPAVTADHLQQQQQQVWQTRVPVNGTASDSHLSEDASSCSPVPGSHHHTNNNHIVVSTTPSLADLRLDEELVLKVRIAGTPDPDFIEVEMQRTDHPSQLTYSRLLEVCSHELGVASHQVSRIRKLPNTILRKDKDVQRLKDFQEVELVVNGITRSSSTATTFPAMFKNQTILY